ncbi:MAG: hypothetical protein GX799_08800 [Crenarchaeota archaeon]|nr:hypothetical protein [Thermoproteota archaeon]
MQIFVAKQCFKLRGGMHDTLILTKTVKGIQIPKELHTYERIPISYDGQNNIAIRSLLALTHLLTL